MGNILREAGDMELLIPMVGDMTEFRACDVPGFDHHKFQRLVNKYWLTVVRREKSNTRIYTNVYKINRKP